MAQICRAFTCTPTQALAELERGPFGLVMEVMEVMAYMDAKHEVEEYSPDDAKNGRPFPEGEMVDEVMKRLSKK